LNYDQIGHITHVIANSQATKRTILQNNPNLFPEHQIAVIYNGFNTESYGASESKHGNKNYISIKTLGRLEPQKNQLVLLDVAQRLKLSNLNFKIEIGGDGSLKKELQREINARNLQQHVSLQGFISDSKNFIADADIFVLPSK